MTLDSYVINLRRRPDRLEGFTARYPGAILPTVFEAVDGRDLAASGTMYEAWTTRLKERGVFLRLINGEIGCALSHMGIWQRMLDDDVPVAQIFEDDCLFVDDYVDRFANLVVPDDALLIYTGGRDTPYYESEFVHAVPGNESVVAHHAPEVDGWGPAKTKDLDRWLHAYIVTQRGARYLLEHMFDHYAGRRAVDHAVLDALRSSPYTTYDSLPHICYSIEQGDSEIRNWQSRGQRYCPIALV